MALEIPSPIRVIAYKVVEGQSEIYDVYDVYEVAGNRSSWKWWYSAIRSHIRESGCKIAIERPGQIPPVRLN